MRRQTRRTPGESQDFVRSLACNLDALSYTSAAIEFEVSGMTLDACNAEAKRIAVQLFGDASSSNFIKAEAHIAEGSVARITARYRAYQLWPQRATPNDPGRWSERGQVPS